MLRIQCRQHLGATPCQRLENAGGQTARKEDEVGFPARYQVMSVGRKLIVLLVETPEQEVRSPGEANRMLTEPHKRFRRDSQPPIQQNINVARPSPKQSANISAHAYALPTNALPTSAESDRASLYEPSNVTSSDSDGDEENFVHEGCEEISCPAPTSPEHSDGIVPSRSWRPRPAQRTHAARTVPCYIDPDDEPLATRKFGSGNNTSRLDYGDTDKEPLARRRSVLDPTKESNMTRSGNALMNKSTAACVDSDQSPVERNGSHPLPPNSPPRADQASENTRSPPCSIPIFIITTLADIQPSAPNGDQHEGAGYGIFEPSVEKDFLESIARKLKPYQNEAWVVKTKIGEMTEQVVVVDTEIEHLRREMEIERDQKERLQKEIGDGGTNYQQLLRKQQELLQEIART